MTSSPILESSDPTIKKSPFSALGHRGVGESVQDLERLEAIQ